MQRMRFLDIIAVVLLGVVAIGGGILVGSWFDNGWVGFFGGAGVAFLGLILYAIGSNLGTNRSDGS